MHVFATDLNLLARAMDGNKWEVQETIQSPTRFWALNHTGATIQNVSALQRVIISQSRVKKFEQVEC